MIFNINFFLFCFAQSGIWSYTCVYAKYYANVSNVEFGTLAMILPLLAFFSKPIACSISDAKGKHREVLIGSLIAFGLSYGSLAIIPFVKDRNNHETDSIAWIVISILMSIGYVATACIFCMNDALASNYARKHNQSYSRMRIYACGGWSAGALLIMSVGEIPWLPPQVFGCILLVVFAAIDIAILILWPYEEDFEMFHDGSTIEQRKLSIVGPNTMALMANMRHRGSISRDLIERIKAGRSKSVGGLPRIETLDLKLSDKDYTATNSVIEEKKKEYSNFECQLVMIKLIATNHKSLIRYVVLFTIFGLVQGMCWTFQFEYLKEKIAHSNEEEFKFLSTLCMIAQTIPGEILINIVAMDMLRLFGSNANLSLALVCLGLRCFCYSNVVPFLGTYSVFLSESLQGPSLGLYWTLTVDIGSNYALMVTDFIPEMRKMGMIRDRQHEEELSGCSRATMIGIMSSSMEGLGVASGAFLGGIISAQFGYDAMWNICATIAIVAGFANIGWDLFRKLPNKRSSKERKTTTNLSIPTVVIEDSDKFNSNGGTKL